VQYPPEEYDNRNTV